MVLNKGSEQMYLFISRQGLGNPIPSACEDNKPITDGLQVELKKAYVAEWLGGWCSKQRNLE
jgi:hypothetical protein